MKFLPALLLSFVMIATEAVAQTGTWQVEDLRGVHYAVERSALHPDRWRTELLPAIDCTGPACEGSVDGVSALHLRYKWAQLNPAKGVYQFEDIGGMIDAAVASNKRVTLSLMGGKYTPYWVLAAGAGHISTAARTGDHYSQPDVPLPWDDVYLLAYQDLVQALSAYLRQTPSRYDAVKLVKSGAVVIHSGETRLLPLKPFDTEFDTSNERESEALRATLCRDWAAAGYTEERILGAMRQSTAAIAAAFPHAAVGLSYVNGSNRFPTVNRAGNCVYPKKNSTMTRIIKDMVHVYGSRAIITNTFLTPTLGNPPIMEWVRDHGGHVAFQIARQIAGCSRKESCNKEKIRDTFENGFDGGALFIEVHDGNVLLSPTIIPSENDRLRNRQ